MRRADTKRLSRDRVSVSYWASKMSGDMYCELCGAPIKGRGHRVMVEGVVMTVCGKCYIRLMSRGAARPAPPEKNVQKTQRPRITRRPQKKPRRRDLYDRYEVVEDYAERIREARMRLGWSHAVLANRVGEKENVIRRIEAGRLVPTIDLARRLEKVLKIKLLEPVVEEEASLTGRVEEYTLTLGDIARIRED